MKTTNTTTRPDIATYEVAAVAEKREPETGRTCDRGFQCPLCGATVTFLGESPDSECCNHPDPIRVWLKFRGATTFVVAHDSAKYDHLKNAAIRVVRGYTGTRLWGAFRRAGLAEILRPCNSRLLDEAIAEGRR